MKRFVVSVLCAAIFSIGLGALVQNVGAKFKSDEKALALIRQARIAIGGEPAIQDIQSMVIKGTSVNTIKIGTETRTEPGEIEIAMQLPDKMSKRVKIGRAEDGALTNNTLNEKHDIVIMKREAGGEVASGPAGEKKVFVRKIEGEPNGEIEKIIATGKDGEFTTADGKKVIVRQADSKDVERIGAGSGVGAGTGVGVDKVRHFEVLKDAPAAHTGHRQNELLRTALSLLLTPPVGMDVSYAYAGEGDVDGAACNIVVASFGGQSIKLYLSKASSLPVMVSYEGHALPRVMHFKSAAPEGTNVKKDTVIFNHKVEGPMTAEYTVRFADYRAVNGVQLPHKWTTTVNGQTTEVFDVSAYEINPANIADKFQNQKVMVRMKGETK